MSCRHFGAGMAQKIRHTGRDTLGRRENNLAASEYIGKASDNVPLFHVS